MRKLKKLPKGPFSYKKARSSGLSKHTLRKLVKKGQIERISRGVYQIAEHDDGSMENAYRAATLRCELPSCVCLLSALEYYNLTDQIAKKVWMLVPVSKRIRSRDLKLIRTREPKWNIGIQKTKYYWITSMERTLIDCLLQKRMVGSQVALAALKRAIAEKKVKLGELYDTAKLIGVEHRVKPYIEALAS
jgi:predicted transcriptional regulator of viral defense system